MNKKLGYKNDKTKMNKEEVIEYLNKRYPTTIERFDALIERVHQRYPLVDLADISLITRYVLEFIRDNFIREQELNIEKFMTNFKIRYIPNNKKHIKKDIFQIMATVRTPYNLEKMIDEKLKEE